MYRIGEFSKITGLTLKALRYYDEQEKQDFEKAETVKLLRSFDFSLIEIKDVLSVCKNRDDLDFVLREKQEMIKQDMISEKKRIKELERHIAFENKEPAVYDYKITVKQVPAVNVASIRFRGQYNELAKDCRRLRRCPSLKKEHMGTGIFSLKPQNC